MFKVFRAESNQAVKRESDERCWRRSRGRKPAEMRQHFKIFAVRRKFGSAPAVGQLL